MKRYTHLTPEERYQIRALMKAGHSQVQIAAHLGRSPSTVSRELARNRGGRGYRPPQARAPARDRARRCRTRPRIAARQRVAPADPVRRQRRPERIADRADLEGTLVVSHESTYRFVYAEKRLGGGLRRRLRGRRRYRKRHGGGRRCRGRIPGRLGIEHRPATPARRNRIGRRETDTVHGRCRRGAVLRLVERRARFTRPAKLPRASAPAVHDGACRRLRPIADRVDSPTADNGRGFAAHRRIADDLGADFYFADPYAARRRGTDENTAGPIRQYLPETRDFTAIAGPEIRTIENRLNRRPRTCLGYLTPYEVFHNTRLNLTVALRG